MGNTRRRRSPARSSYAPPFKTHIISTTLLESHGLVLSGLSPDKKLVEMIELKDHPYFVACQFHPEFKSRPMLAHPLFKRFVRAMIEHRERAAARPASEAGSRPIVPAHN